MTQDWTIPEIVAAIRAELPTRMVSRDLAADGAPAFSRALESYLDDEGQRSVVDEQQFCNHPTLKHPGDCPTCENTGLRVVTRYTYRRPMRTALRKLARTPVPKGRPGLHVVIWALAANDGNESLAIGALSKQYAYMFQPIKARRWIGHALWELRAVYREDVPAREIRGKSDAQLDAEAKVEQIAA